MRSSRLNQSLALTPTLNIRSAMGLSIRQTFGCERGRLEKTNIDCISKLITVKNQYREHLAAIGETLTKITNTSREDNSLINIDLEGSTTDLHSGKIVSAPVSPSILENEPSLPTESQITTKYFISQCESVVTPSRVQSFSPVSSPRKQVYSRRSTESKTEDIEEYQQIQLLDVDEASGLWVTLALKAKAAEFLPGRDKHQANLFLAISSKYPDPTKDTQQIPTQIINFVHITLTKGRMSAITAAGGDAGEAIYPPGFVPPNIPPPVYRRQYRNGVGGGRSSQSEFNYKKSVLFLDTKYVVPTGSGLPICLNAVGTAAVNLQLAGFLKADNFSQSFDLDMEAKIRPRSELIVMKGDEEERQTGITQGRLDEHLCSNQTIDQTLGLKFCAHFQFPNASLITNSSTFILNGPTNFAVSLEKADPTAKKTAFTVAMDGMAP
uniref:Uncharacterized protein n=1 Tax=Timema monikensis TaxID=170555 RepID=A0A7R9EIQ3_9NEOP|nr:unnamed protein product [Timema monikensis]